MNIVINRRKDWFAGLSNIDSIAVRTVTSVMKDIALNLFSEEITQRIWPYMFTFGTSNGNPRYTIDQGRTRAASTLISIATIRGWGTENPELTYVIGRTIANQVADEFSQRMADQKEAPLSIDNSVVFVGSQAQNVEECIEIMQARTDDYATVHKFDDAKRADLDHMSSILLIKIHSKKTNAILALRTRAKHGEFK